MERLSDKDKRDLIRILTKVDGRRTAWAYDLFDAYNELFFNNELPTPLITCEILFYGHCLGLTDPSDVPHIKLHVALIGRDGSFNRNAWGGTSNPTTATFVFLHEMIHVAQRLPRLKELVGVTSHNATNWVSECNRLSEPLELPAVCRRFTSQRDGGKVKKLPDPNEPTAKATLEGLKMDNVSRFPHGIAELVFPGEVEDWGNRTIKRLGLPKF